MRSAGIENIKSHLIGIRFYQQSFEFIFVFLKRNTHEILQFQFNQHKVCLPRKKKKKQNYRQSDIYSNKTLTGSSNKQHAAVFFPLFSSFWITKFFDIFSRRKTVRIVQNKIYIYMLSRWCAEAHQIKNWGDSQSLRNHSASRT